MRLAAGGGALILMGWSGAEMLRSPLSAPMIEGWWGSAGHFLPLVALMLFPVIQMQHFCSQHRGFIVCIATITFVMASYLVLFANVWGIDQIFRSGAIIPGYVGRLAVGWVFLVIAAMSHLILRLYRPAAQPREEQLLPRIAGHSEGMKRVIEIVEYARTLNIPNLTLYIIILEIFFFIKMVHQDKKQI